MHRSTGSSSTRGNTTPSRSPQHRRGNRRQSPLAITHPSPPPRPTRPQSGRPLSRSLPAPPMGRPRRRPYSITSLATNPRRTLFRPSSRSFIATSPSSSRRSSPIRANPRTRAVLSSRAPHRQEAKKLRRLDGRKRSRTTRRKFISVSVLLAPSSTCPPAFLS